ncbi:MAG TPA: SDR family oxidoreductase [Patescibacteria group bacterium]|nr:SDR family oxidoreductase [Patescibacteria group bacterium]
MTNWNDSLSREYFAEFRDRGVIIAGGAAGIGAALADALAWLGAKVAVVDKNKASTGISVAADLTDEAARKAAMAEAIAKTGNVCAFVSTLGFDSRIGFDDLSQEQAELLMRVNFFAPVFAARDVLPAMREAGGGAICLFTSRHGSEIFEPDMTGYGCAKAALDSGIKRLAIKAGEGNTADNIIRVFGFCPGWVQSDNQKARFSAKQFEDAAREQLVPVGMTPADIVPAIIFSLSKHSRLLSGTTLRFDAGEGQVKSSAVTAGSKKAAS